MYALFFQCSVPLTFCVVVHTTVCQCSCALTVWLLRHQLRYFVDHHPSPYVHMFCQPGIPNRSSPAICMPYRCPKIQFGYCVSHHLANLSAPQNVFPLPSFPVCTGRLVLAERQLTERNERDASSRIW